MSTDRLPQFLYHGSGYEQSELMPGFLRSGELVRWDETESNEWLYTTTEKNTAIELGLASSIEKIYGMERYSTHDHEIIITTPGGKLDFNKLLKVPVFLYTIAPDEKDDWVKNKNKVNGLDTEWKTHAVVEIVSCEKVDIRRWLTGKKVIFHSGLATEELTPAKTGIAAQGPVWMTW